MQRIFLLSLVAICCLCGTAFAQTGRWTHQLGIEIGPQYAFDAAVKAENGQNLTLKELGIGLGAAVNYYYKIDHSLFISVSGVVSYFGNGYFRRQNADGTFPVLNTYYFKNNPLINLAVTAGIRYNFAVTGFQPYVGFEVGSYSMAAFRAKTKLHRLTLLLHPKSVFAIRSRRDWTSMALQK